MLNYYYHDSIENFLKTEVAQVIGTLSLATPYGAIQSEFYAWENQVYILKEALEGKSGSVFFEFSVPRMGKRIDCLLIIQNLVFILEFKVGERHFLNHNIEQVWDYALDLKSFHQPSHEEILIPILIATHAPDSPIQVLGSSHEDLLYHPICTNASQLRSVLGHVLEFFGSETHVNGLAYAQGSYQPTPTIIEAAVSLYKNHTVEEITKNDSEAVNLSQTTDYISQIISQAKENQKKAICFVTGVPGAGKTLVGLKVATDHLDKDKGDSSVYLSGNGPLVAVLQEALTRDKVENERANGVRLSKKEALKGVKSFIQIIHHYRDEYLRDEKAPFDHVAIFDEAQRAWTKEQTVSFMTRKKGRPDFDSSEPEFLISCLDRHSDWAVIVCLVGGGQEINTGEAGISAWIRAIQEKFPTWETHVSPHLSDSEYNAVESLKSLSERCLVHYHESLHLAVSMRSIRAEKVSLFVKQLLDQDEVASRDTLSEFIERYPIVLTRSIEKAKAWLKEKARGSERYGLVVSSQAYRLKPLAIDVKSPINPVHWFLNGKDDIRSSYFLEDVATEFQVQGLELDWSCLVWDGDLRHSKNGWQTFSFKGNKWQRIQKDERQKYLINAYRVLLTRARRGMIILVPEGNPEDTTRKPEFYDKTFEYLKSLGIPELEVSLADVIL